MRCRASGTRGRTGPQTQGLQNMCRCLQSEGPEGGMEAALPAAARGRVRTVRVSGPRPRHHGGRVPAWPPGPARPPTVLAPEAGPEGALDTLLHCAVTSPSAGTLAWDGDLA